MMFSSVNFSVDVNRERMNLLNSEESKNFRNSLDAWVKSEGAGQNEKVAADRILYTYLEKDSCLSLRNGRLKTIPSVIGHLTHLESLIVTGNYFSDLPSEIGLLVNLTSLDLSENSCLQSLSCKISRLVRLENLHAQYSRLEHLAPEMINLVNLRGIYCHDNRFKALPEWIGEMISLEAMNFGSNQLEDLPASMRQLTNLTLLNLGSNCFKKVPESIQHLKNLSELSFIANKIESIPAWIGNLKKLTLLCFARNHLVDVPSSIGDLENLTHLDLSDNKINSLPQEIGCLKQLKFLSLNNNKIKELNREIGQLFSLRMLCLARNELESLPEEIGHLTLLEDLYIGNNPLASLPTSIEKCLNLNRCDHIETPLSPGTGKEVLSKCRKLKAEVSLFQRLGLWETFAKRKYEVEFIRNWTREEMEMLQKLLIRIENSKYLEEPSDCIVVANQLGKRLKALEHFPVSKKNFFKRIQESLTWEAKYFTPI